MNERGEERVQETTGREHHAERVNEERTCEVLPDDAAASTRYTPGLDELEQIVPEQNDVGRLSGYLRPRAHGDPDVGLGERRSVVDPVPDHRDLVAAFLDRTHLGELLLRQQLGVRLIHAEASAGDFASSSNFGRLLSSVADDGEWRTPDVHARAREKHRVIRSHLKSIPDHDAGVLQCVYALRAWPVRLRRELGRLTGIVVRLSCVRKMWPPQRSRQLAVDASNAELLHAMIRAGGDENLRVLRDRRRQADLEFAHAVGKYTLARRGRSPWT